MNREDVLEFLSAVFADFIVHSSLIREIAEIIERSGFEAKFFNLLLTRLKQLREFGVRAVMLREFESLAHNAEGIYSMHLSGKGFNIRILYSFLANGSPVLLLGFHEKSGKRATEYQTHIPLARHRLDEIMEEHNHGE